LQRVSAALVVGSLTGQQPLQRVQVAAQGGVKQRRVAFRITGRGQPGAGARWAGAGCAWLRVE